MTNENDGITDFCAYWLAKKQRNCKMRVKVGALYCAEHLTSSTSGDESTSDKRIPCPLDPAHSVYESRLKAHLKKCNAKVAPTLPVYFSKDINLCEDIAKSDIKTINPTIAELVERISEAFDKNIIQKNHPISKRFKQTETVSVGDSEKHRLQQEALSQLILERIPRTKEKFDLVVVIEFGAGKGGLSNYLWENSFNPNNNNNDNNNETITDNASTSTIVQSKPDIEFILIDRSNSKCKKDAKMKNEGAKLERIFIDIKDLNLDKLLESYDKERTYFLWVSKHLCGAATCLTINSCINLQKSKSLKVVYKGTFCVALCCHQCCSWNSYPNKEFLFESGLIRKEDEDSEKVFKMFCSITSWAVCGFRDKKVKSENSFSDSDSDSESESKSKKPKLSFPESELFSKEKKEEIGRKMKRLFDHGRELKLNSDSSHDNTCQLKHYIHEEVTLENAVLVQHIN